MITLVCRGHVREKDDTDAKFELQALQWYEF